MGIILQYNNDISKEQWLANRNLTLGASEVSPVCFGSKYTSNLEIFYQKVTGIKWSIQNIRTYTGHLSESIVDGFYPYYEGTEESVYLNGDAGKKLRTVENRNVTGINSKWPHLSATPDRFTTYNDGKKVLTEYKNTQSYVLKMWKPGLPLDNVIQNLTQCKIFEYQYGELFYYIDNMKFELHELDAKLYNKQWQLVLDRTTPFWENVEKGRKIYNQMYEAKRNYNMKLANELDVELQKLEPPIQYTDGYLKFINEKYKNRAQLGGREATAAEIEYAKRYADIVKKIDKLEKEKQQIETMLRTSMKDVSILNLGKHGNVTWQQYESRRVFKVNYK